MNRLWIQRTVLLTAILMVAMLATASFPEQAQAYGYEGQYRGEGHGAGWNNGRHRGWRGGYVVRPGYYPPPVYYPPPPPAVIISPPYPSFNVVIPFGR